MQSDQKIKQLETELQELLQRALQAPLGPVTEKLLSVQKQLGDVEDVVKEIKEVDLGGLSHSAQSAEKQIKSIKLSVEKAPEDFQKTVHPLLQKEINLLAQTQHAGIEQLQTHINTSAEEKARHLQEILTKQLKQQSDQSEQSIAHLLDHTLKTEQQSAAALEQTSQDLTAKIAAVATSVVELQEALAAQTRQSSSALEHAAQALTTQISAQATSISKLQTVLDEQARQCASSLERTTLDLAARISALAEIATEQRSALVAQSEQMGQVQRQQAESPAQLAVQVTQALQPVRQWLIAAVTVASAGLIGTAVLAVRQFY